MPVPGKNVNAVRPEYEKHSIKYFHHQKGFIGAKKLQWYLSGQHGKYNEIRP